MADSSVSVAKDKEELLKRITSKEISNNPPFKTYASALAFAAAYGAMKGISSPLGTESKNIEPVRAQIFRNQNLYRLIELLALHKYNDPKTLSDSPEAERMRMKCFEEYANGGLEVLTKKCEGKVDALDAIVLIINSQDTSHSDEIAQIDDIII